MFMTKWPLTIDRKFGLYLLMFLHFELFYLFFFILIKFLIIIISFYLLIYFASFPNFHILSIFPFFQNIPGLTSCSCRRGEDNTIFINLFLSDLSRARYDSVAISSLSQYVCKCEAWTINSLQWSLRDNLVA